MFLWVFGMYLFVKKLVIFWYVGIKCLLIIVVYVFVSCVFCLLLKDLGNWVIGF